MGTSIKARRAWLAVLAALALVAALVQSVETAAPAGAAIGDLTATVVGDDGSPIPTYKWLLAAADTGDPQDALANCLPQHSNGATFAPDPVGTCQWPSIRNTPGAVALVSSGDETNLSPTIALPDVAPGRYLLSVLADGYQLGGDFVVVPETGEATVTVSLHAFPIPLGTVRARVFKDTAPVDGTYEAGLEDTLAGFEGHLSDPLGPVTTDYFGNPLCTAYEHSAPDATHPNGQVLFDADGAPIVDAANSTGRCVSDANGDIVIPNVGPNRYGVTVTTPAGQGSAWVQTTNLEGGHDIDVWTQQNDTGLDQELVIGGEPVPPAQFGFVPPTAMPTSTATGSITGQAMVGLTYIGGKGGVNSGGEINTAGGKYAGPVDRPWVSLSDLENGDQMVYTGRGATDGTFSISDVPDGTYQLTLWDDPQQLIIWSFNVTVKNGAAVDVGQKPLVGWFTTIEGYVFVDSNANGKKDAGESGVPGKTLTLRERDNSLMDQFTNLVTTDQNGRYVIKQAYPLSKWLILEHFDTRLEGTGVTVQAYNEDTATTYPGAGVDINVLPIIGIGGRIDWGVRPYAPGTNGGIAGTVTYDTTRNELDPRDSATEDYQPGVPGIPVSLYAVARDEAGEPLVEPALDGNGDPNPRAGAFVRAAEIAATTTSETWAPPKGCTARQWDGTPLTGQRALPEFDNPDVFCMEAPMTGFQAVPSEVGPDGFAQTVNGNYGFGAADHNLFSPGEEGHPQADLPVDQQLPLYAPLHCSDNAETPRMDDCPVTDPPTDYDFPDQMLRPDDYLVGVDIPEDGYGRPLYEVTKEEDLNVFDGDGYLPQENYPVTAVSPPGGAPSGSDPQPEPPSDPSQSNGIVSPCAGPEHIVDVTNQNFIDGGGSPFEGQARRLCTDKLVRVSSQQSVAPTFHLFTDVPLPTHFWGLVINDLGLSYDDRSMNFGEAQGIANIPVGIYDWSGRLVDNVDTDFNGYYESLLPSTSTFNCPLPAGPCANMYRFVGNDPGQPGHPNPNHSSRFRTIATNFQAWPGLYTVTDTAPTMSASTILTPGGTDLGPPPCDINPANAAPAQSTPEVYSASKVVFAASDTLPSQRRLRLRGKGFGNSQGAGRVLLDTVNETGSPLSLPVVAGSWSNTSITVTVPLAAGPLSGVSSRLLHVRHNNGRTSINGITVQLLGLFAPPAVLTVDGNLAGTLPPDTYRTIQAALDSADGRPGTETVLVRPGRPTAFNPKGAYLENLVVHTPVRLQGFGPGGSLPNGVYIDGTVIDGQAFDPDGPTGQTWLDAVGRFPHGGPASVPDAAGVTVLPAPGWTAQSAIAPASIDGFQITGNTQSDFAGNVNVITGGVNTAVGADGALVTQGGGVYVHAGARDLRITNNLIAGNSGAYAGGIRVGTPYSGDLDNDRVRIGYNQIRDNGGTNLAGGVGIFNGADGYTVDHNEICGNFSAEYGGGLSHYGKSDNATVHANRVYFNSSYDEGGGVMIAGQLPSDPSEPSAGSGPVTLTANEIVQNLGNDDGGGLRLLQAGNFRIRIDNNLLADNVSTHEGGGIALDDSPNVEFVNNTVMNNLTTATALTSDGFAAPAGLSTTTNSAQLQAQLPAGSPTISKPVLFNNIFWDNRAGTWTGTTIAGIGLPGDATPVDRWDMGSQDGSTQIGGTPLTPRHSVLQTFRDTDVTTTNMGDPAINVSSLNPRVPKEYDISVSVLNWRGFPAFRQTVIVTRALQANLRGDYHLGFGSPAINRGRTTLTGNPPPAALTVTAPTVDLDGDPRVGNPDAGAYER